MIYDLTRPAWGRNSDLKQNQETGLLEGFVWLRPGPKVGDEMVWRTVYGTARGRFVRVDWTVNVDDMFRVSVEVVERITT